MQQQQQQQGPPQQQTLPPSLPHSSQQQAPPGAAHYVTASSGPPPPPSSSSSSSSSAPSRTVPTNEQLLSLFKEKMIQTGDKARLKALLNARLTEVGWKAAVVEHCRATIQTQGLEKTTVDSLVQCSRDMGRKTVPDHVRAEMLEVRHRAAASPTTAPLQRSSACERTSVE